MGTVRVLTALGRRQYSFRVRCTHRAEESLTLPPRVGMRVPPGHDVHREDEHPAKCAGNRVRWIQPHFSPFPRTARSGHTKDGKWNPPKAMVERLQSIGHPRQSIGAHGGTECGTGSPSVPSPGGRGHPAQGWLRFRAAEAASRGWVRRRPDQRGDQEVLRPKRWQGREASPVHWSLQHDWRPFPGLGEPRRHVR